MNKKIYLFAFTLIIFFLIIFTFNKNSETNGMTSNKIIRVRVNEPGIELKNRYPETVRTTHQPVGVTFYKIDWNAKNKGVVLVDMSKHSFEVDNTLSFIGSETDDLKNEGMSQLNVVSGLTGPNGISHQDAHKKFLTILNSLKSAGWQSVIPFSAPRLRGKDMLTYLLDSQRPTTLDAAYLPSLEEWMKLPDLATWEFYAERTFLRVNFVRDNSKLDVSKPGAYVVNFTLESDLNYFRGFVPPLQREQWQDRLPIELKQADARRKLLETELLQKGVRIDENYQDPPIPK